MTVESASYIDDLVSSNPSASDYLYEGDDHIKLIKAVLLASFPNIGAAVTATAAELNTVIGASGTLLSTGTAGQWVQLGTTGTVTGTPSVLDFINGTAGVVISSSYDMYLIDFANLKTTSGVDTLRIQVSEDTGGSFPAAAAGCYWQSDAIAAGASGITQGSAQGHITLGNIAIPSSDPGASGQIRISRPLSGDLRCQMFAEMFVSTSTSIKTAGILGCTAAQFDAIRLTLSASTFAGSNARVRFFARRV